MEIQREARWVCGWTGSRQTDAGRREANPYLTKVASAATSTNTTLLICFALSIVVEITIVVTTEGTKVITSPTCVI